MPKTRPMKRSWLWISICGVVCCAGALRALADFSSIDLEVESVQIQPPRPQAGQPISVAAVIHNNGSQSVVSFDISVTVRQNNKMIYSIHKIPVLSTLPRMGSGKSVPVDIGKFSAGDYEVVVQADPENHFNETNEQNNVRVQGFHVSPVNYA